MKFNEDLFKVMRLSQHPPHLQEDIGFGGRTYTPTFIYCWYDKERSNSAGAVIGPYGERLEIEHVTEMKYLIETKTCKMFKLQILRPIPDDFQ